MRLREDYFCQVQDEKLDVAGGGLARSTVYRAALPDSIIILYENVRSTILSELMISNVYGLSPVMRKPPRVFFIIYII